jgi:PAS domain S-box-containing protein
VAESRGQPDSSVQLRALLSSAPLVLTVLDADGVCCLLEGKGLESLGLGAGSLVGRPLAGAWTAPGARNLLARALRGEAFSSLEELGGRWLESHCVPIRGSGGELSAVVLFLHDVTEQRRAEQALQTSELRFQALVERSSDVLLLLDSRGRCSYASPNIAGVVGYDPLELEGREVFSLVHPEDRERARSDLRGAFDADGPLSSPYRVRRRDGSYLWVEGRSGTYPSSDGEPRVVVTFRDVDARLHAEERLRESEERYRRLVDLSPLAMAIHCEGTIAWANDAALRLLGAASAGELIGRSILDFIHPSDHGVARARIRQMLTSGVTARMQEERFVRVDGRIVDVEVTATPIRHEDRPGVLVLAADVSERKRADAALRASERQLLQAQKLEAVGRLAGGVAHDFNNMLQIIFGHSESLLAAAPADAPGREELLEIRDAARSAAAITRQLLSFSRREVVRPQDLDLSRVVEESLPMLRRVAQADVQLELELGSDLGRVRADRGQLEHVLVNLLSNARDAMPDGGRVTLRTRAREVGEADAALPAGRWVELVVSDTGCGIEPADQTKVFEPFYTTKEMGRGSGLGLASVYGIVRQCGGTIRLSSEPGRGSEFRLYFPCLAGAAPEGAAPAPCGGGRFARVLVVEDEPRVRSVVRRALESDGYDVLVARSPEEALDLAADPVRSIDVLVSDVVMSGMSGRALARSLRSARPWLRVLLISGYPAGELDVEVGADADGFLQKPFEPSLLLRRVRELL